MKKLWGIRHIRWFYHSFKLYNHLERCRELGIGLHPQQSDLDYLEMIRKGKA